MKKYFFFLYVLFFLGVSCAQGEMKYIDAKIDANKIEEANADLSQIEVDFCDKGEEKAIKYTGFPGQKHDICYKATNFSDKNIEMTVEFVDGSLTNDQRKNKACMQQGENKLFGQYVTGFVSSFVVPAHNIAFHHANIELPKSATGLVHGCLVYYTKSVKMGDGANFSVLMRKAKFIDIQNVTTTITYQKILVVFFLLLSGTIVFLISPKKTKKINKKNHPKG